MSSRQEEKERRRQERLELERREAAAAARKRRLGIVGATVLGVAALVAVGIAVTAGDGGGKSSGGKPTSSASIPPVAIPAQKTALLSQAAKAAGCQVRSFPDYGRNHVTGNVKYKTNPPTSGDHAATPAQDGSYAGGPAPAPGNYVHALEHGRIEIQYKPGLPRRQIGQLETLFNERQQYVLLFQNNTGMVYPVAVTAWTRMLACPKFTPDVFDAIRAFRDTYTLKAPEAVTQAE